MKKLLILLIVCISSNVIADTNIASLRNSSATIQFELRDAEEDIPGLDLELSASCATGDIKLIKDGAAGANTTNCFVNEGFGQYSLILTAGELDGKVTSISIIDQTAPKVWIDKVINIYTYGDDTSFHTPIAVEADIKSVNSVAVTNVNDFKANVSGIESNLVIINNGVKKASKFIPHNTDLD